MKSNWIKYVFIIFIVFILIFAVYKIKEEEQNNQNETEVTSGETKQIKEIKLGIASLDTINPILSNNKNVQDISKLIYEPLVNLTADYKSEACLAKEWAKQSDNSYLIKLRENVRWSNGQRFTSADVRFTIDRLKDTQTIYSANVQDVTGVDIIDDYTLKINLDKEIPFFEYNLTFPILSKDYYEGEDFSSTSKNSSPVGTGKFKITDAQSSYIILEKNSSWWNKEKEVGLEKITVNLFSSIGELYNSFKIGNLDLIGTSNDNLQEYIGTIGYSSKEIKGREHAFLAFNTSNYFLSKQEIRRAIAYSIDKTNITASVFNSKYYTSSFPLDYGNWLCQEQDSSSGYNLDQAKQVLVDNGWFYKNNYWQKTENYKTQKIALNLLVKSSDVSKLSVAQNIKGQLENQGIRINIVQASDEQYNKAIESKNYDIALCSMYVSPSPNLETFFGEGNLANYSNEEVTDIMNQVKNTTDENILKEKPIVLPRYLFNYYLRLGITAEELIILIFVIDEGDKVIYDPSSIGESLGMDKYKVMELLNNLSEKKIISIIVEKNSDGKSAEYISLDLLYSKIMSLVIDKKDEDKTLDNSDIYSVFESEFGRTISPMECQVINGWIEDNFSHELIMEALKEAIYNGANSLRYIETVLYTWRKKGYKTKRDVMAAKEKMRESKKEDREVFYYDWLNDD